MCKIIENVHSENPKMKVSVNTAIVEGTVCTGNGYSQVNEICSVLNMQSTQTLNNA